MHDDEDLEVVGTTSDYLIQKLTDEEEGKDFAIGYLKSRFMSSAANALFYMRLQAGLTQAQVAERLHTKQSAIARLEGDFDGRTSLRRYVDFALACGMVPHDITFAPLESAIDYTIAQPETLYTQVNHQEWLKANDLPIPTSFGGGGQVESDSQDMSKTDQAPSDALSSTERGSTSASTNRSSTDSPAVAPHQGYFQPYLIPPLQLLLGGKGTSSDLEPQDKTANLTPSKVG
jgi:transcriptional regulator with XRE-family HTH domain